VAEHAAPSGLAAIAPMNRPLCRKTSCRLWVAVVDPCRHPEAGVAGEVRSRHRFAPTVGNKGVAGFRQDLGHIPDLLIGVPELPFQLGRTFVRLLKLAVLSLERSRCTITSS